MLREENFKKPTRKTIKIIVYSLFLIFIVQSCSMVYLIATFDYGFVYYYEKKFQNFEKKAKLKKEDARKIYSRYCERHNLPEGSLVGAIPLKNWYVFWKKPKLSHTTTGLMGSVYVHAKTGKIKYNEKNTCRNISSIEGWRGDEDSTSDKHKGNNIIEQ